MIAHAPTRRNHQPRHHSSLLALSRLSLLLPLLLLLLLLPCPSSAITNTINVGVALPLTGADAPWMVGVERAYKTWAAHVNSLNHGAGYKVTDFAANDYYYRINLNVTDDRSNADHHAAVVQSMVDSGVHFLLGGHFRFASGAATIAAAANVPTIHCCLHADTVLKRHTAGYLFSVAPQPRSFTNLLFHELTRRGLSSIGIMYAAADPNTVQTCIDIRREANLQGFDVKVVDYYETDIRGEEDGTLWRWTGDLHDAEAPRFRDISGLAEPRGTFLDLDHIDVILRRFKNTGVKAVFTCAFTIDAIHIASEMDRLEVFPEMHYMYPALTYAKDRVVAGAGVHTAYTSGSVQMWPSMSYTDALWTSTDTLRDLYANKTLTPPDNASLQLPDLTERGVAAAAAGSVLLSALQRSVDGCIVTGGSIDTLFDGSALECLDTNNDGRDRFLAAMKATSEDTVTGAVEFDVFGQNAAKESGIVQTDVNRLWEEASLTSKLTNPIPFRDTAFRMPSPGSETVSATDKGGLFVMGFGGFNLFLTVLCILYLWKKHMHPAVKKSRVLYLSLIALGTLLLAFYPLTLLNVPIEALCNFRYWILNGGFLLVIAGPVNRAIHRYRVHKTPGERKQKKFRSRHAFFATVTCLVIGGGNQAVGWIFAPEKAHRGLCVDDRTLVFGWVYTLGMMVFPLLLLLVGCVRSIQSRHVKSYMHESKFLIFLLFHHTILLVLASGFAAMAKQDRYNIPNTNRVILHTVLSNYAALSTTLIILVPKVLIVLTTPELSRLAQLKANVAALRRNVKINQQLNQEDDDLQAERDEEMAAAQAEVDELPAGRAALESGAIGGPAPPGSVAGSRRMSRTRKMSMARSRKGSIAGSVAGSVRGRKKGPGSVMSTGEYDMFLGTGTDTLRVANRKINMLQKEVDRLQNERAHVNAQVEMMKVSTTEQMTLSEEVLARQKAAVAGKKLISTAVTPVPETVVKLDREKRDSELVGKKKEGFVPTLEEEAKGPGHPALPPSIRRYSSEEAAPLIMHVRRAMESEGGIEPEPEEEKEEDDIQLLSVAAADTGPTPKSTRQARLQRKKHLRAVAMHDPANDPLPRLTNPAPLVEPSPEMLKRRNTSNNKPVSLGMLTGARVFRTNTFRKTDWNGSGKTEVEAPTSPPGSVAETPKNSNGSGSGGGGGAGAASSATSPAGSSRPSRTGSRAQLVDVELGVIASPPPTGIRELEAGGGGGEEETKADAVLDVV